MTNHVICKFSIRGVSESVVEYGKEIFTPHIPRIGEAVNVENLLNEDEKKKKRTSGYPCFDCVVNNINYKYDSVGRIIEVLIRVL